MTDSVRLLAIAYGLPPAEMEATLRTMPLEHRVVLLLEHGDPRSQASKAEGLGASLASYKTSLVCARAWLRGAVLSRPPHDNL